MKLPLEPEVLGPFRGHVAVDWDGTLVSWDDADGRTSGGWLEGAQEFLLDAVAANIGVIVHSCRATWVEGGGAEQIAEILQGGGFDPYYVRGKGLEQPWVPVAEPQTGLKIGIWCGEGKPVAWAYIDDRGVHFTSWAEVGPIILTLAKNYSFAA